MNINVFPLFSFLIPFNSVLEFWVYKSWTSFVKFVPKDFILFEAIYYKWSGFINFIFREFVASV